MNIDERLETLLHSAQELAASTRDLRARVEAEAHPKADRYRGDDHYLQLIGDVLKEWVLERRGETGR